MKKSKVMKRAIALFCSLSMMCGSLYAESEILFSGSRVYAAEEETVSIDDAEESEVGDDPSVSFRAERSEVEESYNDETESFDDETESVDEEEPGEAEEAFEAEEEEPESVSADEIDEAEDEAPAASEEPVGAVTLTQSQLEKFYHYEEDPNVEDGLKLSLTAEFRQALNTPGGSLTAGDYTWKEFDPVPDPGVEYVDDEGHSYAITSISGLFADLDKVTEIDMSGWNSDLDRPYRDMSGMFRSCGKLESLGNSLGLALDTKECTNMTSMFYFCSSLKSIGIFMSTEKVESMAGMFRYCTKLEKVEFYNTDTSSLEKMNFMFESCSSLKWLNLESFGTGKVREMYGAFEGCYSLEKLNLSNFDFSYIEPETGHSAVGSDDIFDTAGTKGSGLKIYVRDEEAAAFIKAEKQNTAYDSDRMEVIVFDLNSLDDDFLGMIYVYTELPDGTFKLSLNDTMKGSYVTGGGVFYQLFYMAGGAPLPNPDSVNSIYHGKISSYEELFRGMHSEVIDISLFDGKTITDMSGMFFRCEKVQTIKMGAFQPRSDAKTDNMFYMTGCGSYKTGSGRREHYADAQAWISGSSAETVFKKANTKWEEAKLKFKVKRKVILDYGGKIPNQVINVTDGTAIGTWPQSYSGYKLTGYYSDKELTQPFDIENTPITRDMTLYAKWEYNLQLSEKELESFYDYCYNGEDLRLQLNDNFKEILKQEEGEYWVKRDDGINSYVWHVGDPLPDPGSTHHYGDRELPVTSYSRLFINSNVQILDLSKWDTSNVTDMSSMFERLYKIKKLDVSSFDTSHVTTMKNMFVYFGSYSDFDTLDLRNFDVSRVTDLDSLFEFADIRSINIDSWKTTSAADMDYLFWCCYTDEIYMRSLEFPEGCTYDKFFQNNKAINGEGETYVYVKNSKMRLNFLERSGEYGTAKLKFVSALDPGEFSDSELDYFYIYDTYQVKGLSVSLKPEFKAALDKADGEYALPGGTYTWRAGDPLPDPAPATSALYRDKVKSFEGMFKDCKAVSLDLSAFTTKDATNYSGMLMNCGNLKKLNLGGFQIDDSDIVSDMLKGTCAGNTGTPVMGTIDDTAAAAILNDASKTGIDTNKLTFKKQYVIRFDAGGGSGMMENIVVDAGNSITLPVCAFTAPEDGSFEKWDKGLPGEKFTPEGSCTIKAIWKHQHVGVKTDKKDPGCTTKGNIEYWTCSKCGAIFSDAACTREIELSAAEVPASGHEWGAWVTVKEPTADEEGLEERVCINDNTHKEQRTISAIGYTEEWQIYFDDSCMHAVGLGGYEADFTGAQIKPYVTVIHAGKKCALGVDYTLKYGKNKSAGEGTVTIKGKGSIKGQRTLKFSIAEKNLSDSDVIVGSTFYDGSKSVAPVVAYKGMILKKDKDYKIQDAGDGFINIVAVEGSDYTGMKKVAVAGTDAAHVRSHKIKATLDSTDLTFNYDRQTPLGKLSVTDAEGKTLSYGTDYRVSCTDNVHAGKVTMMVIGTGSYNGSVKFSYKIKPAASATIKATLDKSTYEYSKAGVKPGIRVMATVDGLEMELKEGRDFTCKFQNCKKAGTGSFKLTMKGDFKGAKYSGNTEFTIDPVEVTYMNGVTVASDMCFTKPGVYKPKVCVIVNGELLKKSDYEVSYANGGKMEDEGSMAVEIKFKGNYVSPLGSLTTYALIGKNLTEVSKGKVLLSKDGQSIKGVPFNGKNVDLGIFNPGGAQAELKLKGKTINGTELSSNFYAGYADNGSVGKATVIFRADPASGYAGFCTGTFKITKAEL